MDSLALSKKRSSESYLRNSFSRLIENKPCLASLLFLITLLILAVVIPIFSSYTYSATDLPSKNLPPCMAHLFGTDELGRDIFVRIWCGARISLFVGFSAALIDMFLGVMIGGVAGFGSQRVREMMLRLIDIMHSLPNLLLVILLMVVLGNGLFTIILAMTFTGWINMARIVRSHVLQIKEQNFILAAQMYGASKFRILMRYILPNCFGSILTTMTLTIPAAIFTEAFLSFLGLGVQAPLASWGTMANDGLPALRYFPWRIFFPAAFISLTMLSLNILGNGIRDAFDPRLHT